MGYLRRMLERARVVLISLPPSQRYSVVALLGVVVLSLVMLVTWGGRESYVPVLSELSGPQMTQIQQALEGTNVDYRFRDGTLLVTGDRRDSVLMTLTEKGALPSDISSSFGFEDLVEPQGFNLETNEQQQMKYNIARGNMLARAIATAPEIIGSPQVHVASSRDSYISPEKYTAAVSIRTRPGQPLPEAKLAGICRLVAAAVGPGLPPAAVVVTNLVTGRTFSLGDRDSSFAVASTRMELQQNLNAYYASEVENFFAPILGQVQTLVNVEVDTTSSEMHTTEYEVTRKVDEGSTESGGGPAGGDNLTQPNVSTSITTGGASAGSTSETHKTEKESSPSKEIHTTTPPGEIKDITISVLADLTRVKEIIRRKDGLKEDELVLAERLDREYTNYETILRTGLPFMTGEETAKVSNVSFRAEPFNDLQLLSVPAVETKVGGHILDTLLGNWQAMALAALAVVALLMIKSLARQSPDDEAAALAAIEEEEVQEEILLPDVEVDVDERRARKMRESIEEMVDRDPQGAISLIRRWIAKET